MGSLHRAGECRAPARVPGLKRERRTAGDSGQVTVGFGTVLVIVAAVLVLVISSLGSAMNDRARARTAADAAALAGAAAGLAAATDVAETNGATIEYFTINDAGTTVTVRVGRAVATSRARTEVGKGSATD